MIARYLIAFWFLLAGVCLAADDGPSVEEVLAGLREFYRRTARDDGSFTPGIDPDYRGISDTAYSDLAAVTYACTIHKTFGWKLPHEEKTIAFLLGRQRPDGAFYNVGGTVDSDSAEGRCYNTTQGLVALHALGVKPRHNPLGVFEAIVQHDVEKLPAYSTSFFPLAYLCYGRPIPPRVDRGIRATMIPARDGYLHDHVAATFHASHYYRLIGEPTPLAEEMVSRTLADQKADGSWMLNMPSRDRHAAFDAVFILRQEGAGRDDCRRAIAQAANWALSCGNADGGFGHFPGSPSDADANYFQVGTLVMAGFLKPVDPLPPDAHLLSWGHLMSPCERSPETAAGATSRSRNVPCWIGGIAYSANGRRLAVARADHQVTIVDAAHQTERSTLRGHDDAVVSVAFSPDGGTLATGSFDRTARLWNAGDGRELFRLVGHRGAVMSVAFSPDGRTLVTGSIDGTVGLWATGTGQRRATLEGHKTWVNAVCFSLDGETLLSASSDGTLRLWDVATAKEQRVVDGDEAEIRSVAWSSDGKLVAAGIRYGRVKLWDATTWRQQFNINAHAGDVWSLAFSPDGRRLYTADGDWDGPGQIKVWNIAIQNTATQQAEKMLEVPSEVLTLALSPDGKTLACGGRDGKIHLRDTTTFQARSAK